METPVSPNRMALIFTIFVILACSSQSIDGLRILGLFPIHGKSHFIMCERLVKSLAGKGHQVDVYSHFPLEKPVPNYKDFSLDGTLPALVNNVTYDFLQRRAQTINVQAMMTNVGRPVCELMGTPVFQDLFKRLKKNNPYDLVIIEVFLSNCYLAWGRYLNIPIIGVMTTSMVSWYNAPLGNPINTAAEPAFWSGYFHPMNFWQRLTNTYIYLEKAAMFNYYVQDQNKYVEKYFGPGYPDAAELVKDLDLILVNSHYTLDGIKATTPAVIPVAGIHIVDDGTKLPKEVQKWLDESKDGCIYFSFGSMTRIETFPKTILDAFYATFRNIGPVRVLMKIAKPEVLPPGLPTNVMTQSWFPQIQVLKHTNIKAFVTHGGLMSTQESLYVGVPMVGIPLFGDQPLNIRNRVRDNVAIMVELKDITEETLSAAVKGVLNNPMYKKNAKQLANVFFDRPMSPTETATFWVEYIARHGKKALRSPMTDLPWWKSNLIDVYGFALLVLVAVCYALKLILKRVLSLFHHVSNEQQNNKLRKKRVENATFPPGSGFEKWHFRPEGGGK